MSSLRTLSTSAHKTFLLKATLLSCLFFGCSLSHKIHPVVVPDYSLINSLGQSSTKVAVVLDNNLLSFHSRDKGSPLADPQDYFLGPAIGDLAHSFLTRAFKNPSFYESMTVEMNNEPYKIFLRPLQFDNTLRFLKQKIEIKLEACLYDEANMMLGQTNGAGKEEGWLNFFIPTKGSSKITSIAIQKSLVEVIENLKITFPALGNNQEVGLKSENSPKPALE